jgi:hypothetical protein
MRTHTRASLLACLLISCGTLVGNPEEDDDAGGGGGTGKPSVMTAKAPLEIGITDAPLDEVSGVFVTVVKLELAREGGGWVDIPLQTAQEIDLLSLQDGRSTPLAALPDLEPGTYQQLRLVLSDTTPPRIVDEEGNSEALKVPSGEIKIDTPFEHAADTPLALTIDFDLRKSIKYVGGGRGKKTGKGRYQMKPHLRLVRNAGAGAIVGTSEHGAVACIYASGSAKDATDDCDSALNSAKVKDGRFKAAFVPAGTYDVRILGGDEPVDRDGVVVTAGADTDVGAL